jgi:hypothetical protein
MLIDFTMWGRVMLGLQGAEMEGHKVQSGEER